MLRETGSTLSHFKDASINKGKKALIFSKRAASPTLIIAGTVGLLGGTSFLATHLQEDKKVGHSIDAHVRKIYPKKVSEKEYEIAKLAIHFANKNKGSIDPEPSHIERFNQQIEQENARSQDASKLRDQLKNDHKAKVGPRIPIDIAVFLLSSAAFLAPVVRKKIADKHRINANSPESASI